jgi:hypothetical protein
MSFAGLNYWAVLAAAVASFMFGGVWYGLLSKQWMEAAGLGTTGLAQPREGASGLSPMPFVIAFIAQIVMAWMLAGIIGHLGPGQVTFKNGVISGFLVWLGFVITSLAVNHTFQGSRRSLTAIDGGHWLGVLLIQGAIIGWLGVH